MGRHHVLNLAFVCILQLLYFSTSHSHSHAELVKIEIPGGSHSEPCVSFEGGIEIHLLNVWKDNQSVNFLVPESVIPHPTTYCSSIQDDYQAVEWTWEEDSTNVGGEVSKYNVKLGFVSDWESEISDLRISSGYFALNTVKVTATVLEPDGDQISNSNSQTKTFVVSDLLELVTPSNMIRRCSNEQRIQFGKDGYLTLSNFSLSAFRQFPSSPVMLECWKEVGIGGHFTWIEAFAFVVATSTIGTYFITALAG